jgi:excisionase family DNA binding protein
MAQDEDVLLTPGKAAAILAVSAETVSRWSIAGRLSAVKTPGGHRRFRESEIRRLLDANSGAPGR